MTVKRTERGWAGHYIASKDCLFRRNTLLEKDNMSIVVSTVGAYISPVSNKPEEIGVDHYYETKVFCAKKNDKYKDVDISKEINFTSNPVLMELDDIKANEMHELVVDELIEKLEKGEVNEKHE